MSIVEGYELLPMVGDPDDHRPETKWAVFVDPGDEDGRVDGLAVLREHIAPGDRIPLHTHLVDEVILVRGPARARLGAATRDVADSAVFFIPAGAPHGVSNAGDAALTIEAIYPTTKVWIRMLERNPAPGTEGDDPQPGALYDFRTGEVTFASMPSVD